MGGEEKGVTRGSVQAVVVPDLGPVWDLCPVQATILPGWAWGAASIGIVLVLLQEIIGKMGGQNIDAVNIYS